MYLIAHLRVQSLHQQVDILGNRDEPQKNKSIIKRHKIFT